MKRALVYLGFLVIIAAYALTGCTDKEREEKTPPINAAQKDITEYAPYFAPYLTGNQFVGYCISGYLNGENCLIGIIYNGDDKTYTSTPLCGYLILKENSGANTYELSDDMPPVKFDGNGDKQGNGFELPLGSGCYGTALAEGDDWLAILTYEPTFSSYLSSHLIFIGNKGKTGRIITAKATNTVTFTKANGEYYTDFNGYFQKLTEENGVPIFKDCDLTKLRPNTKDTDVVIEVTVKNPATEAISFSLNGSELSNKNFIKEGPSATYEGTVPITKGADLYVFYSNNVAATGTCYSMTGKEYQLEPHVGYEVLNSENLDKGEYILSLRTSGDTDCCFIIEIQ